MLDPYIKLERKKKTSLGAQIKTKFKVGKVQTHEILQQMK
jgi:hypothetical protein